MEAVRQASRPRPYNRLRRDQRVVRARQKREGRPEERKAREKSYRRTSAPALTLIQGKKTSFDFTLLFIVAILLAFGSIMLYSSSSYSAALLPDGDSAFYLKRQLLAVVAGIFGMFTLSRVPIKFYSVIALPSYFFSMGLVCLVPFIGREINHAKRWIYVGPISIQPSELMKIGVILLLAKWISEHGRREMGTPKGIWQVIGIAGLPAALVWKLTSNLSSGIIIFGIGFIMLFVAGPTYKEYLGLCGLGVLGISGLVWFAKNHSLSFLGYRGTRIVSWINPAADASGAGFQTLQALYAIGSGGVGGKGLGQSMQKLGFLPEAQNDMIFSIICEELGMIGAFTIMVLFLALIIKLVGIASQTRELFSMLIVTGVLAHMALQVLFNIAVVTNTIPNTGISLPFISYGGSAVLCQLAEIGIVLGIERQQSGGRR